MSSPVPVVIRQHARVVVPDRPLDRRLEPDVAAEVVPIGDVLEVAQDLGLGGVLLRPLPLAFEFGVERVLVVEALDVAARARVAVPVPGATDVIGGLERHRRHAEPAQPVQQIEAGHAGADDDHVDVDLVRCLHSRHGALSHSPRAVLRPDGPRSAGRRIVSRPTTGSPRRMVSRYERAHRQHHRSVHRRHAAVPLFGNARGRHRVAVADLVGRERHVRDAQPVRPVGRPCPGRAARREAVRARHVPVPVRQRPPRRSPARLHRHRRLRPVQADDRPQRVAHDGLRCVRPPGRAVRGRDRPTSPHHDRREHLDVPTSAGPPRPGPRSATKHLDHRSAVLPVDAVDLQPDLRRLVRRRRAARPTGGGTDRRVRGR